MMRWITDRIGIVRIRQLIETITHRLAFVPIAMVLAAVLLAQATLALDRSTGDTDLPAPLATTAESARSIFAAIAGGLITAVTLLVSMMLVAVQLASRQFSPRTLRNWLGDATLRRSVGIVLATTTFCLVGLRSIRSIGDGAFEPTVTALTAVVLGIVSLIAVIRAVDHVTQNLQIGTVAQRLVDDTLATVDADATAADDGRRRGRRGDRADGPIDARSASERPRVTPAARPAASSPAVPEGAVAVEAPRCGWVQQIDEVGVLDTLGDRGAARAWIAVVHGGYVTTHSPLAWIALDDTSADDTSADGDARDDLLDRVSAAFAIGPTRTMQRDVGFGLAQLTDIAVRALSPGVNDPQTAQDVIVHLGEVMRGIWSRPRRRSELRSEGAVVYVPVPTHEEFLRAAFDPIRRSGRHDPAVLCTIARTLRDLRSEVARRGLPGPVEPISDQLDELLASADDTGWLDREREELRRLVDDERHDSGHPVPAAASAPGSSPE